MRSEKINDNDLLNLVPKQLVDDWAKYAINEFQKAITKKKIGSSGDLFRSFKKSLEASNGDVRSVIIKFLMYGRFVDMGVGNGVKAYERKSNKANLIASKRYGADVSYNRRLPKKWYNKVRTAQTYRLQELLVEQMGDKICNWLAQGFEGQIEVNT